MTRTNEGSQVGAGDLTYNSRPVLWACNMLLGHARSDSSRAGSAVKLHHIAAATHTAKHSAQQVIRVSQQCCDTLQKAAILLLAEDMSVH